MKTTIKLIALALLTLVIVFTYINKASAGGPWSDQYCNIDTTTIKVVDQNGKIIDEAEYLMGNTGAALEQRMKDIQTEGAQTQKDIRAYVPAGADMEASFGAMSGVKRSLRYVNEQI